MEFDFNPNSTMGCSIKGGHGKLILYSDGEEGGVAWEGLERDQPYWAWTLIMQQELFSKDSLPSI